MKDVADRVGVAESTVSHVVNGTRFVSPDIREKILRAMQDLNYHGNAHARRLARGASDFLGLIISDIENPFFPGLIKAFEAAALLHGYDVLLSTTNYETQRTEKSFRKMIENKTPGVAVMTSRVDPSMAELLERNGIASVFLDFGSVCDLRGSVRINYAKGTNEAINYLHNLGHRRFALIAGPQKRPSHRAYLQSVSQALREAGLEPQILEGENDVVSGDRAVQRLLTGRTLPTAVLCSNDLAAIGALRALLRAGIHVPDDVSVVGADDIPFASLTTPPLSTVRIPREKLGELAFHALYGMLRNKNVGSEELLDTELVIRQSTGAAAKTDHHASAAGEEIPIGRAKSRVRHK